jgi:glycosyltransferase involved in cell wall biosynthesis
MITATAVIPVYNHGRTVSAVLDHVLASGLPCILVDDGSEAETAQQLRELADAHPGRVTLLTNARNVGKGGSVLRGLAAAGELGFSHALQIDADGQHDASQIGHFLVCARAHPAAVITGTPIFDATVPKTRLYPRYLTHFWVWVETLSFEIRDSMCGFRVYPLAPVLAIAKRVRLGLRMDFDIEILVRLYWEGLQVVSVPTPVRYPADGVSHFRLWRDNALITRVHTMLVLGMLWRLPRLAARHWRTA